ADLRAVGRQTLNILMLSVALRVMSKAFLFAAFAGAAFAGCVGKDGGPTGAFSYSADTKTAAMQRQVKAVVELYQEGLNSSNFAIIRSLFTPDAVAEWNDKATVIGPNAMAAPYEALFKEIKFTTDFQYDAVDISGDLAIVRTHHPVGQMEVSLKD